MIKKLRTVKIMLKKKTFLHFMIVALTLSVCLFFVCSCSGKRLTAKLLDSLGIMCYDGNGTIAKEE